MPANMFHRKLLSGFGVMLLLPFSGIAQSGAQPQRSNPAAQFTGTTGYIFTEQALALNQSGRRGSTTINFPYQPLGAAFLVAPNLILGAGMHASGMHKERCFWIPAQDLSKQIPDTAIYEVMPMVQSFTGLRGIDENYALWKLKRTTTLPVFSIAFAPLKLGDELRVCMDDGTFESITIAADEGEKSVFIEEQFARAASGSAVLNLQGKAVGILIPGPHATSLQGASGSPLPLYGNAIVRFSALPAGVVQPMLAANMRCQLLRGNIQETTLFWPYLNLLCGAEEDLLCAAARKEQDLLLDTLLHLACNRGCFDVNRPDETKSVLLHILVQRGQLSPQLQRLLRCAQLQADIPDVNGKTALQHAVQQGQTDLASMLLQRGASVRVLHQREKPLLLEAVGLGSLELCRLLLAHGAWDVLSTAEQEQVMIQVKHTSNAALKQLFKKYKTRRI